MEIERNKNLRDEIRYDAKLLPDTMRRYIIHLNPEQELEIEVVNISLNGLGFIANIPSENFTIDEPIILCPIEKTFTIYGKIVFVKMITPAVSRVGIKLRSTRALIKYQSMLKNIIKASGC